jgi:HPt (histidine-containing phosphotransfer) domain-containing protein
MLVEVSADGVFDDKIIGELKLIGGTARLYNRVLTLFVENAPRSLADIERLAEEQDMTGLVDAVHALKSMCSSLGARRAGDACVNLEKLARAGREFDAPEMIKVIKRETVVALKEADRLRAA